jgi:hypothetical protein
MRKRRVIERRKRMRRIRRENERGGRMQEKRMRVKNETRKQYEREH